MKRPFLLTLGVLFLAGAWALPLTQLLPGPFSAHMTMHMAVVAVAAPLLALGVAGGPVDPVSRWPGWFPPIPAAMAELLVVWAWHAPALHHAAQGSVFMRAIEQGSFLFCGLLVWLSALGGRPAERADRGAAGVVALLLTSMHMTLLGALLALPPRPLYGHGDHDDQHVGGAIMLGVGGVSYLAGGLWLALELLKARRTQRGGA